MFLINETKVLFPKQTSESDF